MSDIDIVILTDNEAIIIIVGLILVGITGLIEFLIYNTDFLDGVHNRIIERLKKNKPKHMASREEKIQTSGREVEK